MTLGSWVSFLAPTISLHPFCKSEDVRHVDAFSRLGDVVVAFGIFFRCFTQGPYYLFHYFLFFSSFHANSTFVFNLVGIFTKVYGLQLFEVPLSTPSPLASLFLHF
jgi:hypothetical protein